MTTISAEERAHTLYPNCPGAHGRPGDMNRQFHNLKCRTAAEQIRQAEQAQDKKSRADERDKAAKVSFKAQDALVHIQNILAIPDDPRTKGILAEAIRDIQRSTAMHVRADERRKAIEECAALCLKVDEEPGVEMPAILLGAAQRIAAAIRALSTEGETV